MLAGATAFSDAISAVSMAPCTNGSSVDASVDTPEILAKSVRSQ